MGIYDRDYWRDRYNKRNRYKEKTKFRQSAEDADDLADHAYFRRAENHGRPKVRPWHPVLQVLLFAGLCLLVLFVVDLVS